MDRPRGQKRWPLVEFRVSIVKFQGWSLTRTLNVVKLHVLFEGHGDVLFQKEIASHPHMF